MSNETSHLLLLRDDLTVGPLTERFDPKAFFQTRPGFYIWPEFRDWILRTATTTEPTEPITLASFSLTERAYDEEIKAELPANHEVKLWHITKLIEGQPNGEEGPLLTNGAGNIFYCGSFAVCVSWHAGLREWHISGEELDKVCWSAGRRVFSRI